MDKKIIIILTIITIIIIGFAGWWFFHKTNKVTSLTDASTKSSQKSIVSFELSGLNVGGSEIIDNVKHTVVIIVPTGTDITNLTPTISVAKSATISPASGVAQNFKKPLTYVITAEDGTTQNYTITVEAATKQGTGGS